MVQVTRRDALERIQAGSEGARKIGSQIPGWSGSNVQAILEAAKADIAGKVGPSHNHSGADITGGTISVDRIGSGVKDATTVYYGDGTFKAAPGVGVVSVKDYNATGNGTTDDTAAIQSALTASKYVFMPPGTYLCGTVYMQTESCLFGAGAASVLKMAPLTNAPMIQNASGSTGSEKNITLSNFKILGNKGAQTALSEAAGIKMIKVDGLLIEKLRIEDTEGHSIHLNNTASTIKGQRVSDCYITGAGSSETGTYGSNFACTNSSGLTLTNVHCLNSFKAGFRLSGTKITMNNCIALNNGNGGLVPVSDESSEFTINGGHFSSSGPHSNNDGIRLAGCRDMTFNGVTCADNYGAGLHIFNGSANITVDGGIFRGNGRHASAPSDIEARDGIAIRDNGTAAHSITINGARCYDPAGTPTQDYGLRIANTAHNIIATSCNLKGNQVGSLSNTTTGSFITTANNLT